MQLCYHTRQPQPLLCPSELASPESVPTVPAPEPPNASITSTCATQPATEPSAAVSSTQPASQPAPQSSPESSAEPTTAWAAALAALAPS